MTDQPDTAARILTAVEAALGDQLTTTAHVQALDHIRRILGDEPAPDAVAPSPKAPQSQDGEHDRLRAELAELEQLREMYQQQSAANAAYRLQIDELIRRTSEYADRAITNGQRAEHAESERDGAYRERAHLLAWLATLHPSVIAPAPDDDEDGWQILYLTAGGCQMSWHIHPDDAHLFIRVEQVAADDPRAQWDGHTTDQKYARMRTHIRTLDQPKENQP